MDSVYTERAHLVAALTKLFPASIEEHVGEDWDDDWRNVCFVDLPTGQVSWHIANGDMHLFEHVPRGEGRVWDGHTTEEKYQRLNDLKPRKPFSEIYVNVHLANMPELQEEIEDFVQKTMQKVSG